jgi:hypothetical protein
MANKVEKKPAASAAVVAEGKALEDAYQKTQQGQMDPEAFMSADDLQIETTLIESPSFGDLMFSLSDVGDGGSMEKSNQILRDIMPHELEAARALVNKLRRVHLAVEALRNTAVEIAAARR